MGKGLRKTAFIALAIVFIVSLANVAYKEYDYYMAEKTNAEAQKLAGLRSDGLPDIGPTEAAQVASKAEEGRAETDTAPSQPDDSQLPRGVRTHMQIMEDLNIDLLRQKNDDILGWIMVPDTTISYPLLQADNNDYYLSRNWQKGRSKVGSIYLEHTNKADFSDFNTIIYGHNMLDNSMFSPLHNYKDKSYWENRPLVYIRDGSGIKIYRIFAAFEAGVTSYTYRMDLDSDEMKRNFLDHSAQKNVLDTGINPSTEDSIITLSTCTGRGHQSRWVVQAVLIDGQSPTAP